MTQYVLNEGESIYTHTPRANQFISISYACFYGVFRIETNTKPWKTVQHTEYADHFA